MSEVVDCEMAKILLMKFGYLEKRVTYLEGKSRRQETLIQKLKMRNRNQVGQSSQVDCVEPVGESSHEEFEETTVDVKPNLIEVSGSIQNAQLDILKHDQKLSQKSVVKLGVRCCENIQEFVNSSSEKSIDRDQRSQISQNQGKTKRANQNVNTGGKSSKPKRTLKKTQICAFCSKSFQSFEHLSQHMRVHTRERPYKCEICSKSFTTKGALKAHTRLHTGEKPYSCSVCSKSFIQYSNLQYHMSIHKGTYSCPICSKKLGSNSHLKIHKRTHTGERPYECTKCNEKFACSSVLKYHMSKHSGTYSCSICSKKLGSKSYLKIHKRTHTGERPYECTKCNEKFACSSVLKYHMSKHSGTYSCSICSKKLGSKSYLKIHKRTHTHTGEKPYKCTKCKKKFIQLNSLVSHRKKNLNCQQ